MSPFDAKLRPVLCLVVFLSLLIGAATGQSRQSGEVRGTVTDQSQAVLPGVRVVITNVQTGMVQTFTTDAVGLYDAPYVPPGEYSIAFSKDAFKTLVKSGIEMHVQTVTVDAALEVGTSSETVNVTATQADLETEATAVSTRFTSDLVADAPSINRDWMDILASLPGVNSGGAGGASSGQTVGVNGQGSNFSQWQINGGIAMLGNSANPDMLDPPPDTIEEVSLETGNFGADRGSGFSVFNVVTKSGTNEFHGTVYEYIENTAFNAIPTFALSAPPVHWNDYGFDVGGPIKRNKAFFFVGFDRTVFSSPSPTYATFPTTGSTGYTSGNFAALLGGPAVDGNGNPIINPCTNQQSLIGQIFDPATTRIVNGQTCRDPFPGNIILQDSIDKAALAVQSYFPAPNVPSAGLANNYYLNMPYGYPVDKTTIKLDYDVTSKNHLTGSLFLAKQNQQFYGTVPIDNGSWKVNEPGVQITDVLTMGSNLVSEFRFGLSREYGLVKLDGEGKGYPSKLGLASGGPVGAIGDLFPTLSMEGTLITSIGPYGNDGNYIFPPAIDAETTIAPSETLTWVKGRHIFKFGGEFNRWRENMGWGDIASGNYDFSGVFTQNPADIAQNSALTEGEGYADFLLGAPSTWSVGLSPETGGRMYSVQAFAQDEYKLKPNLTLTLGLRYVVQSGWTEVNNELSSFDPTILDPLTGTLGDLWYAGQRGRRALTKTKPSIFSPRVGFAWAPDKNWSIRGGFGIYNVIPSQALTAGGGFGQGFAPAGFLQNFDTPVFQLSVGPPAGKIFYPTSANVTPNALDGNPVSYTIYDSPVPYTEQFHFDVQHELKGGIVLDVGYVGNRGVNMLYARDANQVPPSKLGQGLRPYPQFATITGYYLDGHSNYNALQVVAKKQLGQGLSLQSNYTWSKALDTQTSSGWHGAAGSEAGGSGYQNADAPEANYGRAGTDLRHVFSGNLVYKLPFGEGKRFLQKEGVVNALAGGWEISSIYSIHSGSPFNPYMNSNANEGALSGTWRPNEVGNPNAGTCSTGYRVKTANCWFNDTAFVSPPIDTFGNTGRNILDGPGWRSVDLSMLKDFSLREVREGMNLQFKCTASNVFNHVNLQLPSAAVGSAGEGVITGAYASRKLQFGLTLNF